MNIVDFSAVKTLTEWMQDAAKAISQHHPSVQLCATALNKLASPSTGLGLVELWSVFRRNLGSEIRFEVEKLDRLAINCSFGESCTALTLVVPLITYSQEMRGQILNLIAMRSLPRSFTEEGSAEPLKKLLEEVRT
jgi:hypothetical protein